MTDKPTYPTVSDATLIPFRALEVQLGQFPDLLERADCPYPQHIRGQLAKMLLSQAVALAPLDDDDLVGETSNLYREVQRTASTMKSTDPKDQMAIFKTSATLLEKLVELRERALNVRNMGRFQRTVVELLEGVLDPAQRSEFVAKLGKIANV